MPVEIWRYEITDPYLLNLFSNLKKWKRSTQCWALENADIELFLENGDTITMVLSISRLAFARVYFKTNSNRFKIKKIPDELFAELEKLYNQTPVKEGFEKR
jgi:hypothetical protein